MNHGACLFHMAELAPVCVCFNVVKSNQVDIATLYQFDS